MFYVQCTVIQYVHIYIYIIVFWYILRLMRNLDCMTLVKHKLESIWKEAVVAWCRYNLDICLEGLRATTRNLIQDSRVTAQIRTENFSNTNTDRCRYVNLLSCCVVSFYIYSVYEYTSFLSGLTLYYVQWVSGLKIKN